MPQDSAHYDLEAAQFLARCERRAKSGGSAGCLVVVVSTAVLAAMGALGSAGGWAFLVVGAIVVFGLLAKQAVRKSVEDFQHTFRSSGGAERREQALQYLWERANGSAANTPAGKAAKDVLAQLGLRARPRSAAAPERAGMEPLPVPVVVSEAPPAVSPPGARPPHAPLHRTDARSAGPPGLPQSRAPAAPPGGARTPVAPPRSAMSPAPGPARPADPALRGRAAVPPPRPSSVPGAKAPDVPAPQPAHEAPPRPSGVAGSGGPWPAPSASGVLLPGASTAGSREEPSGSEELARSSTPAQIELSRTPSPESNSAPQPASSAATPPRAPEGSAGASTVRCDSCGLVRTVRRGESVGLCPTCYPQIRLDA